MRVRVAAVVVAVLAAAGSVVVAPAVVRAEATTSTIVTLRSSDAVRAIAALERAHGFRAEHRYTSGLRGFSARLSARQREALRSDPRVSSVHDDRDVRLVTPIAAARRGDVPTGVRRVGGGSVAASVAVAVIDTGIDLRHPALDVSSGANCIAGKRRTSAAQDDHGHGTHVAGTIGAKAGGGAVGVAPGTKLYAVKVLDARGSGTVAQVICGIDWVTANAKRLGIAVANLSFGALAPGDRDCGVTSGDPLHEAICRSTEAGVTYVVAAGNDAADLASAVPASYPEVLTVTAVSDSDGRPGGDGQAPSCMPGERDDAPATFSNYATRVADLSHVVAAPGVCITSTWPGGGTKTISGTSMAAPHATAVVALCISSGRCPREPESAIRTVMADAERHATDTNGYDGDHDMRSERRYGSLVWAGK
ncbi:MAG: S8 family serine peptidase [Chloroflexota bacterium]|nr:S8 family serine peptidase [Chloroflexota bacterium]